MQEDWLIIYSTSKLYLAEMVKEILEDNEIEAVIMNKRDSSYLSFGDIEVYVRKENKEKAEIIIKAFKN